MATPTKTKTLTTEMLAAVGLTEQDVERAARHDRLAKMHADKASTLKDKIKAALKAGNYSVSRVFVKRSTSYVLDTALFMENFPPEQFPQYYKPVLNTKAIPEDMRESFTVARENVSLAD